jgi:CHAT domain-containing protein/predicted negative regulator of RcsB-dependent stress response
MLTLGSTARPWRRLVPAALALSLLAGGCGRQPESGIPGGSAEVDAAAPEPGPTALQAPTELNAGEAVDRSILPGERHDYRLLLESGDFFEFEVEQHGIDVELSLIDPQGEVVLVVDLPIADLGPERLLAVATRSGDHVIRVEAWASEDPEGGYLATLVARRRAGRVDELRSRAAEVFYQGERESWDRRHREAIGFYERAAELWREAGDDLWEALTLDRGGDSWSRLGRLSVATELHERAAALLADLNEPRFSALNANHLGELYFKRGGLDRALERHTMALELRRRTGDSRGEGVTLSSLGLIYSVRGETQRALDHFSRSLPLLERPEDRRHRATALHDLGTLYRRLGKPDEAVARFKAAERIYAGLADTRRQAYALSRVGQLVFETGDAERALRILGSSLELSRQHGDLPGQVATLRRIGSILLAQGEPTAARQCYVDALELLAGSETPRAEAEVLADLGELNHTLGRGEASLEFHRRARTIFERVGDPLREAAGLLGEAAALRQLGRLQEAREPAERALEVSETLRVEPFSEDLRLSFFSTTQSYFDFNIDLLMDLHALDPTAGHDAAALQVSERARARSLIDLLSESRAEIRGEAAPRLLEQEQEMQYRLNRNALLMESEGLTERQRQAAVREVRQAMTRLDAVRAEIRQQSPGYAALTQPRPLTLAGIQRLLDDSTALLEFRLGTERSHLWLVTRRDMASFELPPGPEIESNARQSHLLMMQGRRESEGRVRALLCALSRQLLEPAAGRLGRRRLAIVADGALEYLPFAALPDPESAVECIDAEPLVVAHEIVNLPSASTLAVLRREAESRKPPAGTIAVLADPVFGLDDARLGDRREALPAGIFHRLPHTRGEAEAILELVPEGLSYRALGFAASREAVLSGRLEGYGIVHFATHGQLNAEEPALSRIVLSQIDRQGGQVEGSLWAHDIYNLKLPANLVVLSGCETALGKAVRGEGLVGLARGFMYAGASRVMVSLWRVSDRGTAELMDAFYRGLLLRRLAPAAALRQAQLELRSRRPQHLYWAGFVLEGDWLQSPSRP